MGALYAGLAIFISTHLFPRWRSARGSLVASLGATGYQIGYSLVSIAGFALMVYGYRNAPFIELYEPVSNARAIAHALMPFAFVLLVGAYMPSNLKRYVRNPMAWATLIWAITHLTANGDLASVVLFGGFALFAALHLAFMWRVGTPPPPVRGRIWDLALIGAGLVAYGAAISAHGRIFGVYVVG